MWVVAQRGGERARCAALRGAALLLAAAAGAADLPSPAITFDRDVLPILQKHCQQCHRPGEVAPMPLLTYEDARPWAKAIKVAVLTKKMPPWPADPRYGRFARDPTLDASDIKTLTDWVDGGELEGDARDQPAPLEWPEGWRIPPDAVIEMPRPIAIPAKGTVELTEIRVPTGFTKDTWVRSIEIRPGNRAVVHHAIVRVVPHDEDAEMGVPHAARQSRDAAGVARQRISRDDRLRSLFAVDAVYVPGNPVTDFGLHQAAKLIPAGSDLVIQMHYTPNGAATTDQTRIGFTFAREKPARRFLTVNPTALRDQAHFRIPAGAPNWETRTVVEFNQDAAIVWFMPHMHLRGKDMTYRLVLPNGATETLLSVKFDFQWQMGYDAASPIPVTRGTRLEAVAHYDNSPNNRFNPNPNTDVWWGDQTWEEMMVPWFGLVVDADKDWKKAVSYPPEFSGCPPGKKTKFCRDAGLAE